MIAFEQHTDTHLLLLGTYPHRNRLKALDLYPDLRYDGALKCWLVDVRTLPMLYGGLGDVIAEMSPEFWMTLPLPSAAKQPNPKRRRRRTYEERAQAAEAGRAVVATKGALQ